jgi:DNA phosphorothioation system restriction enzyme
LGSLRNLHLVPVMDTSNHDLTNDFFKPLLLSAQYYDRGVGFFSSAWLRLNCEGMVGFANHGGRARWITSPILDPADWEALQIGDKAREDYILRSVLKRNIANLETAIQKDTLSALAWMIADEVITFKLALPQDKLNQGDFHAKFGIFTDALGEKVCFNGSYNDSIQGIRNYESIMIFCSWESQLESFVQETVERFERLWNNQDPNVRTFDLPEAAREQILQLRTTDRPYTEPAWIKLRRIREVSSTYQISRPILPNSLSLRDYQEEAIKAWFDHQCKGLLEMATGSGKTITALAASVQLYEREQQLAVIITVPYQHLVDQWSAEAKSFGYRGILAYKNKKHWLQPLKQQIMEYNAGYRQFISVITTHTTFTSPEFQNSIAGLKGSSLILADEAHHLGSEQGRYSYPEHIPFRLALSATPDRWFDDIGTEALRNYFGETVFSFPLEKAIGICLTPYYYYPHLVSLTDEEFEEYQAISVKIARLFNKKDGQKSQALEMLLIRRARLMNNAENKLTVLSKLIEPDEDIKHTLFYTSPEQIDAVTRLVGWERGLRIHRFTAEENTHERQQLLADFAAGKLQALVAMKCLDEGVDVPTTTTAYILASSGNPREFIQRRGRILRKAPGKEYAYIYDLITVPPEPNNVDRSSPTFRSERSILRKELQRFKEFANLAQNKYQALEVIWELAKQYGLMDF